MTSGVRLRPAEQVLGSRARDFLAAGPADAVDLIGHVCQLPSPPRFVADHMAMALLAPWEEFARENDGRWRLVRDDADEIAELTPVADALAGGVGARATTARFKSRKFSSTVGSGWCAGKVPSTASLIMT